MHFLTAALLISALASPADGFAPSTDELKCGSRPGGDPGMPDAVVLLDHELLEGDREDGRLRITSMADDIYSVHVVCWRWIELNYGVQVRVGGSYVLTKGWIEQTRRDRIAALEALAAAQDRHRDRIGEFAARVEELADFGALSDYGLPNHLALDLIRNGDGWQARLEPRSDWSVGNHEPLSPVYRCFVYAGVMPEGWEKLRRDGEPGPRERKPECYEPEMLSLSATLSP